MSENTTQKAVTLEALTAAAPLLATKENLTDEVKRQIENLLQTGGVTFATTEEVLALFTGQPAGDGGETGGE